MAETEAADFEKRLVFRVQSSKTAGEVFPWRGDSSEDAAALRLENQLPNRVEMLTFLKIERRSNMLVTQFRNDYPAEIAGYAAGWADGSSSVAPFVSGGAGVAAGGTFQIQTQLGRDPEAPVQEPRILCVVFKDRTGDGDAVKMEDLNQMWAGRVAARAVFLPELRAITAMPESEIPDAVERLTAELQAEFFHYDPANPTVSTEFVSGVHLERGLVRSVLMEDRRRFLSLKDGEVRFKQALIHLMDTIECQ